MGGYRRKMMQRKLRAAPPSNQQTLGRYLGDSQMQMPWIKHGSAYTIVILVPHGVRALDGIAIPSYMDLFSPHFPGRLFGNRALTGPAKRDSTMRCIIQAFPLSKAPAQWVVESLGRAYQIALMLAVGLRACDRCPLRVSHVCK
jgi:hypothetical protein